MKKLFSVIITALLLSNASFAQRTDSITFVKSHWIKKRLAPKVKLYFYHFNAKNPFAANQNISYVELKNTGRRVVFALAADSQKLITTENFAEKIKRLQPYMETFSM